MLKIIQKTLPAIGACFALAVVFNAAAAQAEPKCVDYYNAAGKFAAKNAKDLKSISILLGKAGNCCAVDVDPLTAQKIAGNIKIIVAAAGSAVKKRDDRQDAGKVMSAALGCAGQPSIVAVDPALYSAVLADSSEFAELARDENGGSTVGQDVQFARQHGNRPSNNQQPTVSIEQK